MLLQQKKQFQLIRKIRMTLLLLTALGLNFSVQALEFEIWHAHQARQFIEEIATLYEKESGHTVNVFAYDPDNIKAELLLGAGSGILPDAFIVPSDYLGLYRQLKLSPLPEDWNITDLDDNARQTTIVHRRQYGIPVIQGNHLMMFFNKALVSEPATTWKEMLAQKPALEDKGVMTIGWNYGEMYWFVSFVGAFGGWPMDGSRITLKTPGMIKALPFYKSLSSKGLLSAYCNYDCAQRDFVNERFAYAINGDWAFADLKNELGDKLGVAKLPSIGGTPLKPMSSTYVIVFPELNFSSKRANALKRFALLFQREDVQRKIYSKHKLLPVNSIVFREVQENAEGTEKIRLEQLEDTKAMPSDPGMAIAWQAMAEGYQRFMTHGYSAEEAANFMQSLAEKEFALFRTSE